MFTAPLGLLALLAVPAIVGLHLLRRRFRPQVVSAVFLWAAEDRAPTAGRKREPLRTSPSFWCETLAALLLALALAGPRVLGAGDARHLVVVLDSSASMGAVVDDASARDRAADEVRDRLDGLPRGSRATLVATGPRPAVLAGPAAFLGEAAASLEAWRPTLRRHDLGTAVALAQELAGEEAVVVVTDRFAPETVPPGVELVAVGRPAGNVAITSASRRRADGGEDRAGVTVTNHADAPTTATLALTAEDVVVARRSLELGAGARRHVGFDLPADAPMIEARLAPDALAVDDVAWLAPPPPRTIALASTLGPELERVLGLAARGAEAGIDRWLELVPDSVEAADPSAAHLVIAEGVAPGAAWVLALAAPGEERRHLVGPFLVDRGHPLLDGVTLDGVVWTCAPDLTARGAPLVRAGDLPLLTEVDEGRRLWLANLDARRSTLARSPDWPILLANAAELRRAELPGAERTTLAVGEPFRYRARGPGRFAWEGPDGRIELDSRDGRVRIDDVATPGVHTLSRLDADGVERVVARVGYSFVDAAESDLTAAGAGTREGRPSEATVRAGFTWIEVVLLALALALVALDWWVLARRSP